MRPPLPQAWPQTLCAVPLAWPRVCLPPPWSPPWPQALFVPQTCRQLEGGLVCPRSISTRTISACCYYRARVAQPSAPSAIRHECRPSIRLVPVPDAPKLADLLSCCVASGCCSTDKAVLGLTTSVPDCCDASADCGDADGAGPAFVLEDIAAGAAASASARAGAGAKARAGSGAGAGVGDLSPPALVVPTPLQSASHAHQPPSPRHPADARTQRHRHSPRPTYRTYSTVHSRSAKVRLVRSIDGASHHSLVPMIRPTTSKIIPCQQHDDASVHTQRKTCCR